MNKNILKSAVAIFFSAIIFFGFKITQAHVTGASWEKVVGDYKIDLGYDPTTFVAGQPERFDFNLVNTKTGEAVEFSDVWVRISSGQDTVFASGIHRLTFGLTTMTFEFPRGGDYNLNVRFENDDNTITQAEFPISVEAIKSDPVPAKGTKTMLYIVIAAVAGLVIGFGASFIFRKK